MKTNWPTNIIDNHYGKTMLAAVVVFIVALSAAFLKDVKHVKNKAFVTGVLCGVNATHDIYLEGNPKNDNIDEIFRRVYAMPGLPEDYKP